MFDILMDVQRMKQRLQKNKIDLQLIIPLDE